VLIVLLPPGRIDQRLVRFGNPLEHRLGGSIARVDPGVIPSRQPSIRALDLRGGGAVTEAENGVEIHTRR
jgi:hypothetical protein